jgi:hypothetical protein
VKYSRAELDWIEERWAFVAKGRPCTLSQEDFAVLLRWEADGVPAATVVEAIDAFGRRLALRPRRPAAPRLAWAGEDLARVQQGQPVRNSGTANEPDAWDQAVKPPLRNLPMAKAAWVKWRALRAVVLHPDAPGYLDHQDAIRGALKELQGHAEALLGGRLQALKDALRVEVEGEAARRALDPRITKDLTERVFARQLQIRVLAAWNIPE